MQIELSGSTEGVIQIELLENVAPDHVQQIIKLVNKKKYDGKKKEDRNQHRPSEKRIALTNIKQVKTDGAGNTSAS